MLGLKESQYPHNSLPVSSGRDKQKEKNMKKFFAIFVLVAIGLISPTTAFSKGFLEKLGKEAGNVLTKKPNTVGGAIGKIWQERDQRKQERKERKRDAKVNTEIQAEHRTVMNKIDRIDHFETITFRNQEEAIAYWNQWYQRQLSKVYDDFRTSCRENPNKREELKKIRDEDIRDLKQQLEEELSRYGNSSLLTVQQKM